MWQERQDSIVEQRVDVGRPEEIPVIEVVVLDADGSPQVGQFGRQPRYVLI